MKSKKISIVCSRNWEWWNLCWNFYLLKEKYPDIRIIGVEPEGSVLNGGDPAPHEIEGIGVEFIPPFLSPLSINQIETISDVEGFNYTGQLAREQGLLVGSSSGLQQHKRNSSFTTWSSCRYDFSRRSRPLFIKNIYL